MSSFGKRLGVRFPKESKESFAKRRQNWGQNFVKSKKHLTLQFTFKSKYENSSSDYNLTVIERD